MPADSEMKPSSATTRALWSSPSVEPNVENAKIFRAKAQRKQKSMAASVRPCSSKGLTDDKDSQTVVTTPATSRIVESTNAAPSFSMEFLPAWSRPSARSAIERMTEVRCTRTCTKLNSLLPLPETGDGTAHSCTMEHCEWLGRKRERERARTEHALPRKVRLVATRDERRLGRLLLEHCTRPPRVLH